jgi:hypothetical protein
MEDKLTFQMQHILSSHSEPYQNNLENPTFNVEHSLSKNQPLSVQTVADQKQPLFSSTPLPTPQPRRSLLPIVSAPNATPISHVSTNRTAPAPQPLYGRWDEDVDAWFFVMERYF